MQTVRFTSKFENKNKFKKIFKIDCKVKELKNNISLYIFNNLQRLIEDKKSFLADYKMFRIEELSAWETQTIYQDIVRLYENQLYRRKQNLNFNVQSGTDVIRYKRNVKNNKKGDVKEIKLKKKKTTLCKVVKYLAYCDLNKKLPEKIIEDYKDKSWFPRLLNFVIQIQKNIISSLKLIQFNTGTYKKSPSETKKYKYSYIFKDDTNSLYKWWYAYKVGKERIYIPLQINEKYHKNLESEIRFDSQCYVKVENNKIHILTTKNSSDITFKEFSDIIGVDINVKNNFCFLSDGMEIDYDRKWIGQAIKELKKIDKSKQTKKLSKIKKRNEWYFKFLINKILNYIEEKNISDIVLENLNAYFLASHRKNAEFEIKYSRLIRILRLSNIKHWIIQQANKRGIRVHLTNPAYTSQTCSKCGHISKDNRKTQERFECISCGYSCNADYNSSINIKNRISLDVLKNKLHTFNSNGIYIPKKQKKETVKDIIEEFYESSKLVCI